MDIVKRFCFVAVIAVTVSGERGRAVVKLKIRDFDSRGRKADGDRCDFAIFGGITECDPKFIFCLDKYTGNNRVHSCEYHHHETDHYDDDDSITFGSSIDGMRNPIVAYVSNYEGIRFKVDVDDEDAAFSDNLDFFDYKAHPVPARNEADASIARVELSGTRNNRPAKMTIELWVFCDVNSYSDDCSVYCQPEDEDGVGHFGCHPETGQRYCLEGWEDVENNCLVKIDNCEDSNCMNGGQCVDLFNDFRCHCPPGFTGSSCAIDVDECESMPCQNAGVCRDTANGYVCECSEFYTGENCQDHVCNYPQYHCQNGGTCYEEYSGSRPRCYCAAGFTGLQCDVAICQIINCVHGECRDGICECEPNFVGGLCDVRACDRTPCQSGGSCQDDGSCACPPGYSGEQCQETPCARRPCFNDAMCLTSENERGFECRCQPGYSGAFCDVSPSLDPGLTPNSNNSSSAADSNKSSQPAKNTEKEKASFPLWAIVATAGGVLLVVTILAFVGCRRYRNKVQSRESHTSSTRIEIYDTYLKPVRKASTDRGFDNPGVRGQENEYYDIDVLPPPEIPDSSDNTDFTQTIFDVTDDRYAKPRNNRNCT